MIPKLYYVPGFISLLLLFPLFYHAAGPKLHPQTAVSVYLPKDKNPEGDQFIAYTVPGIEQRVQSKQQTRFWLGEDAAQSKLSLQMIQQEALQLKLTHDTNRVVAAVLLPSATFNDFVSLINICLINEHKRYALARDTFYIFADPPPNNEVMTCGGVISKVINVEEQPPGVLGKMKIYFDKNILPYWYWWCCYAALVSVAIVSIKRSYWPRSSKKNLTPH